MIESKNKKFSPMNNLNLKNKVSNDHVQHHTEFCCFPLSISFKSMLFLLQNSSNFIQKKLYSIISGHLQTTIVTISTINIDTKNYLKDEAQFNLIYPHYISAKLIQSIKSEFGKFFKNLQEMTVHMNYSELIQQLDSENFHLRDYMKGRDLYITWKIEYSNQVIFVGTRTEINALKDKLPEAILNIEKKYIPLQKFTVIDDSPIVQALPDKTIDSKSKHKKIEEIKLPVVEHEEELSVRKWNQIKSFGAEKFMKRHEISCHETFSGKGKFGWCWSFNGKWIQFNNQHSQVIEESDSGDIVLLDPLVVDQGGTLKVDFKNKEITNLVTGEVGILVAMPEKKAIYFDHGKELIKVSSEITTLILDHKYNTNQETFSIFGEDFVVDLEEMVMKNNQIKQSYPIEKRQLAAYEDDDRVKIKLSGSKKNMEWFLKDYIKIQIPGTVSLPCAEKRQSSELSTGNQILNNSFISDTDYPFSDLLGSDGKSPDFPFDSKLLDETKISQITNDQTEPNKKLQINSPIYIDPYSKSKIELTQETLAKYLQLILDKAENLDLKIDVEGNLLHFSGPGNITSMIKFILNLEKEQYLAQNFENLATQELDGKDIKELEDPEKFKEIKGKLDEAFGDIDPTTLEIKQILNKIQFEKWLSLRLKSSSSNNNNDKLRDLILDPKQNVHVVYNLENEEFPLGIDIAGPSGNETFILEREDRSVNLLSNSLGEDGIFETKINPTRHEINLLD